MTMTLKQWVTDYTQQHELARILTRDLYQSCIEHCQLDPARVSLNLFSRLLVSDYGFRRVHGRQGSCMAAALVEPQPIDASQNLI